MRYLAHTPEKRKAMLAAMGVSSIDHLYKDVPSSVSQTPPINLPPHQDELSVDRYFQKQAQRNLSPEQVPSFIGAGLYRHHVPSCVDALIQRGEFLTSYTPYQPEISQGTLQYLFEFQTQVCLLTGMEVANASMYDGATATAEAILMAHRVTGRSRALMTEALHPHYQAVIETYGRYNGFEIAYASQFLNLDEDVSCVVVQYPNFFGEIEDFSELSKACQAKGILLVIVMTEVVSLGLIKSPGSMGADIVCGEGQSLGNPLSFGGPTVGLFATRESYLRQMPGRIAGQTVDVEGRRGWVLTLSTREQHIRREKATSNICTNAGLCTLAFTIHLSLLGKEGFQRLARLNHLKAQQLRTALQALPQVIFLNRTFFNEFTIQLPKPAADVVSALAQKEILGGVALSRFWADRPHDLLLAATEMTSDEDIQTFVQALKEVLS